MYNIWVQKYSVSTRIIGNEDLWFETFCIQVVLLMRKDNQFYYEYVYMFDFEVLSDSTAS